MVQNREKRKINSHLMTHFPKRAVRANERTDERVAQYYSLLSTIVATEKEKREENKKSAKLEEKTRRLTHFSETQSLISDPCLTPHSLLTADSTPF